MKKLILILILALTPVLAYSQVQSETVLNRMGQMFIRFYNPFSVFVQCEYEDDFNYITFVIPPGNVSMWYPVYGSYEWYCSL